MLFSKSYKLQRYFVRTHRIIGRSLASNSIRDAIKTGTVTLVESTKSTIYGLMARNMDEKDFKKFFAHWNTRIDDSPAATTKPIEELKEQKVTQTAQVAPKQAMEDFPFTTNKDIVLFHPLLGELIADLGYKRVYMTSVAALARTPVWKKQRILRPERAALIADDKVRKGLQTSLPGVITLYEDSLNKVIGIIDGQHRAGALMILAQRGHWSESKRNIIVEVFPTNGEESISSLFSAINAAEPVRLIDLPDADNTDVTNIDEVMNGYTVKSQDAIRTFEISTAADDGGDIQVQVMPTNNIHLPTATSTSSNADSTDSSSSSSTSSEEPKLQTPSKESQAREIVTITAEILRQKYPDMFKPTSRCKIPHLNIDVFRDDLYSTAMIQQGHYQDHERLLVQLMKINDQLKLKFDKLAQDEERIKSFTKSFQSALQKAKSQGFYLGMEKDWLYNMLE